MTPAAVAQTMFEEGEFKPYDEISIGQDELSASVSFRVLYFAHFTCPYCRNAHDYMHDWADALPRPYQMEVVPAVGLPDHFPMAMAYYAVLQLHPKRLKDYENALFSEIQDRLGDPLSPVTYRRAAMQIGIDSEDFNSAVQSKHTQGFVRRAHELTKRFGIEEVPTVVVANRFKTGPGRVYNDQQSFVSILNGLISMHYQEHFSR